MVGLATYETTSGEAHLSLDMNYGFLKRDLLDHSKQLLASEAADGKRMIRASLPAADDEFFRAVSSLGFTDSEEGERIAIIDISTPLQTSALPKGYTVVSLSEENDLEKINRVLWRGFNHTGSPPADSVAQRLRLQSGPDFNKGLTIAAKSPIGDFVSYCGMWHDAATDYAIVEPVATDPDCRLRGFGRAAVLEGVRRCFDLGAKRAYVGSDQQFYYSIGFRPYSACKWLNYQEA